MEILVGKQSFASETARRKTVLGRAVSVLGPGAPYLIDGVDAVDVQLVDRDQWLTSCDDDSLVNGSNLAVLGSELLQFGSAEPLGQGRFRLTRLLRGRGGTEWAMQAHSADEPFALIDPESLRAVPLPSWTTGGAAQASARNLNGAASVSDRVVIGAESLRPVSPIDVRWTPAPDTEIVLTWTRRSRNGWAWIDGVDAPLGEASERYRVSVAGSLGTFETEVSGPALTLSADDIGTVGRGPATVKVVQVGDLAASRPAEIALTV